MVDGGSDDVIGALYRERESGEIGRLAITLKVG